MLSFVSNNNNKINENATIVCNKYFSKLKSISIMILKLFNAIGNFIYYTNEVNDPSLLLFLFLLLRSFTVASYIVLVTQSNCWVIFITCHFEIYIKRITNNNNNIKKRWISKGNILLVKWKQKPLISQEKRTNLL